ncbi:MAG: alpha/beta hydrolase [Oscillibacter sp.]|nr:alpha/beta hydrolase [Oscillibacter sp.]
MEKKKKPLVIKILLVLLVLLLLCVAFLLYVIIFGGAKPDETALEALKGGDGVTVQEIPQGWLFDGPSEDTAIILYNAFNARETVYAPLAVKIAQETADVFVMKTPLKIAILGLNKAKEVQDSYSYDHWYLAGHSLGGGAASIYVTSCENPPDGLILLGSYAIYQMVFEDIHIRTLSLYGSNDAALDIKQLESTRELMPEGSAMHCIEGGNHSQFGSYGQYPRSGTATITPEEQWQETADWIHWFIRG